MEREESGKFWRGDESETEKDTGNFGGEEEREVNFEQGRRDSCNDVFRSDSYSGEVATENVSVKKQKQKNKNLREVGAAWTNFFLRNTRLKLTFFLRNIHKLTSIDALTSYSYDLSPKI
jgi:hypothetical protein